MLCLLIRFLKLSFIFNMFRIGWLTTSPITSSCQQPPAPPGDNFSVPSKNFKTMSWFVRLSVSWSVCHNFLKEREVSQISMTRINKFLAKISQQRSLHCIMCLDKFREKGKKTFSEPISLPTHCF